MRDTILRPIIEVERNILYHLIDESNYRAKIILLKDDEYTVSEIRMAINHYDSKIRKWIYRFKEKGFEGIVSEKLIHKPIKITAEIEKRTV